MLNWLKVSPKNFIKKVNKEEEVKEESSSMELGSMIHLALLEPGKFTVSSVDRPGNKMGVFCDALVEGFSFEEARDKAGFKQSLETILKKYYDIGDLYVNERLVNKDKIFLDSRTKYLVDKCVDAILQGKESSKLLLGDNALNELEIYWENNEVKKKGKVDRLILSHLDEGIVFNVDVKTTSSNIYHTPIEKRIGEEEFTYEPYEDFLIRSGSYMASFVKYGYHRQLAMYDEGIKEYIKKEYDKDVKVVHLHVVVNTASFESTVYKFSDYWLDLGYKEIDNLIEQYKWHKETNYWETPQGFEEGIVKV
jgi:hypothetical protein